jgi:cbb3-type cytochrome oxidase subunit 1
MFLIGMAGFFGVLTAAGLVQGNSWLNGEVVYRTVPMLNPYYVVRASIGLLFVGASFIGLYNVYRTIYGVQPEVKPVLEGRAAL